MAANNDNKSTWPPIEGFTEAIALFESDDKAPAIAKAEKVLENNKLPWYHRIILFLHMAQAKTDWFEASGLLAKAELYWQMARDLNLSGENTMVDTILAELQSLIDVLKLHLRAKRPTIDEIDEFVMRPDYDGQLDGVIDELAEERSMEDEHERNEEDELPTDEEIELDVAEESLFKEEDLFGDEDIFADEEIE